jgi:hypothetical protein
MTVRLGTTPQQTVTPAVAASTSGVTRTVYVDGARTDSYTEDGSTGQPFKTVQAAVNFVEGTMTPLWNDPVTIFVHPKAQPYAEDVVIKMSGVHLAAHIGQGSVRIQRLILTNATTASVAAFIAAGGLADPDTHYGLLVADADYPWDNQFRDIAFGDPSGWADWTVMIMGVGAGTSMCGNECNFMRCTNYEQTYIRLVNYVAIQGECFFRGEIYTYNIAGLWFNRSQGGDYSGNYDTTDDEPSDTGRYGLCGGAGAFFYAGVIRLYGEARMGYDRMDAFQTSGILDLDDDAAARIEGGFIGGGVDAEADAYFRLRGVHIQGGINLVNSPNPVQMDGGRYMGALTDPGGRLTRNVGS